MPTKKKRYQYQLRIGTADDGQPIRKPFYSYISLEDAHKKAEEWLAEQESKQQEGHDICQWVENWMETYKKGSVQERTYAGSYTIPYRLYIKPFFEGKTVEEIKPIDIQNFFNSQAHLSAPYLLKLRCFLKQTFTAAFDNGLINRNPAEATLVLNSKSEPKPRKVLNDEQIKAVSNAMFYKKPVISFILETGLRIGEACGLMWSDIKGDYFKVQRSLSQTKGGKIVIHPPKKDSYRVVPLTDNAKSILASLPKNSVYVFCHKKDGSPLKPFSESLTIGRVMQTFNKRNPSVPAVTAHELRHTYGTTLRRRGVDIYTIQKILGHKDIQMTAQLYVHNEAEVLVENVLRSVAEGIAK